MTTVAITPRERAELDRIGDVLIPASQEMPSLSEADPDGRWLERACEARPDLLERARALLPSLSDVSTLEALGQAEERDPPGVAALLMITAGRYYMVPRVREAIGYPGQGGRDPTLPTYGWDRAVDMLERVVERGAVYRPAP